MLKIRFSRGGRKNLPFYRIVVSSSTSPRDSKFIERLGTYNPLVGVDNDKRISFNKERVEYWLSVGAKPNDKLSKILASLGVKGAEKHKPSFKAKEKGEGLKKKALAKLKKEQEAKQAAEKSAEAVA